jgi:sulfur-oxidizing protein SoxX
MNTDEHRWSVRISAFIGVLTVGCSAQTVSIEPFIQPLAATGDSVRGREVFVSREGGHCVLCHVVPGVALAGNVGPSLEGVGGRFTAAQLRVRVADMTRVNADTVMPTFHRIEGLERVAPEYRGKPVLDGQQVEDIVAYLATLK